MKILHIIDHIGIGGVQTSLRGITEKEKNNPNIFYYFLRNNKVRTKINNSNCYFCKSHSKLNIQSLFELKKLIRNQNINILHCHLQKSFVFGYLLKLLFFKNIKLIFHERGKIFENKKWYSFFLKKAQNKVNLFIAISKETKNKLVRNARIDSGQIKVLHNSVDLERFNYNANKHNNNQSKGLKEFKIKNDDFVIGFAARIVKRKGCNDLICAFNELENKKNIKLVIAGDGSQKDNCVKLVDKLKLNNNVFFLGCILDMVQFYSNIDCFIIPSHWEPFGVVALEAQTMRVPIIASDVPGLNEIIFDKENGLLFEPKNSKNLAKKIKLIYNNKKLREKIIENGSRDVKKYSIDNYLIRLKSIYDGL